MKYTTVHNFLVLFATYSTFFHASRYLVVGGKDVAPALSKYPPKFVRASRFAEAEGRGASQNSGNGEYQSGGIWGWSSYTGIDISSKIAVSISVDPASFAVHPALVENPPAVVDPSTVEAEWLGEIGAVEQPVDDEQETDIPPMLLLMLLILLLSRSSSWPSFLAPVLRDSSFVGDVSLFFWLVVFASPGCG